MRVPNFLAADISFETTILLGILVGPLAAMAGGAALALPALLHGEYWTLPVNLVDRGGRGSVRALRRSLRMCGRFRR